jgi:hypothetical protein
MSPVDNVAERFFVAQRTLQVARGRSIQNPIIVTDSEEEDIVRPTSEFVLIREDTPMPTLRITNPELQQIHISPAPEDAMDVVIPPNNPHRPDSDSDKENIPPHGNYNVNEDEDGNPPPPDNCSKPIAGPSRIDHEERVSLSDPDQRIRTRRRRM